MDRKIGVGEKWVNGTPAWPISKIRPSDGSRRNAVPLAVD
jgi:hypothetical protein